MSERRICRVLGQHRSTHRKVPRGADDEQRLTDDIIALAKQYGRYGYRRVTALLRHAGWTVNRKRVERIWRKEGLKWNSGALLPIPVSVAEKVITRSDGAIHGRKIEAPVFRGLSAYSKCKRQENGCGNSHFRKP